MPPDILMGLNAIKTRVVQSPAAAWNDDAGAAPCRKNKTRQFTDVRIGDGAIGSTVAFGAINLGSSPSPRAIFLCLLNELPRTSEARYIKIPTVASPTMSGERLSC
jgi:hypothetical protein